MAVRAMLPAWIPRFPDSLSARLTLRRRLRRHSARANACELGRRFEKGLAKVGPRALQLSVSSACLFQERTGAMWEPIF